MPDTILVTGGAGFIGSNYVHRLLNRKKKVIILDNLSRKGSIKNLEWLREEHGTMSFELVNEDIRDYSRIKTAFHNVDGVLHLAAQVAVTTSVQDPRTDFEINALGTFNILEAVRKSSLDIPVIFASTNKVYGGMENLSTVEQETRYAFSDDPEGVKENQPLDFHSPYGCSKGSADQYTRDYARIYNMHTVVFRQSCIYGQRQFGVEDQGWLAWFLIALQQGFPITIYGDGKQVRDLLYVDDLLNAYDLAFERIASISGQVFNIGGGLNNSISIWRDFSSILERRMKMPEPVWKDWRPGDQKVYISNIQKAKKELGWQPLISAQDGIERLFHWVKENQDIFK